MVESAYLLLGPELGDKGAWIKSIRAQLRQETGADPEIHRFYPFETENGEIFVALNNDSLFSDHRLVLLSQADELPAALVAPLVQYLKKPSPTATLLIISNDFKVHASVMKVIGKDQKVYFYEMYESQKRDWVKKFFASSNMEITGNAVELLLDMVENNTMEMRVISSQLVSFLQGNPELANAQVTEDVVATYLQHTRIETPFTLFSDIAQGQLEKSLEALQAIFRSGSSEPIGLLSSLIWSFRRMQALQQLIASGQGFDDACKSVQVMGMARPITRWSDKQDLKIALSLYDAQAVRAILALLGETDIKVRELGTDFQQQVMEQCLVRIIRNKGQRPAASLWGTSFDSESI